MQSTSREQCQHDIGLLAPTCDSVKCFNAAVCCTSVPLRICLTPNQLAFLLGVGGMEALPAHLSFPPQLRIQEDLAYRFLIQRAVCSFCWRTGQDLTQRVSIDELEGHTAWSGGR